MLIINTITFVSVCFCNLTLKLENVTFNDMHSLKKLSDYALSRSF